MGKFEVKVSEIYKPAGLSVVQVLCLAEVCEIFVVSKDLYWERGSLEVVMPCFQGVDHT